MTSKLTLVQANQMLSELKNAYVIKLNRQLNSLLHMYISVRNIGTGRKELWTLNSRHGAWEFYDLNKVVVLSDNSSPSEIDLYFMMHGSYEISNVIVSKEIGLEIYFYDKSYARIKSDDDDGFDDPYNLWVIELPNRECVAMNSNLEILLYATDEDAYIEG